MPVLLSAVVFWMTIMPWLVRNYEAMGQFVFIRDNFGNELRIGNNPLAEGPYVLAYHPSQNDRLLAEYKQMGEIAFCAEQGRKAKQWIAENPRKFVVISLRRVIFFWNGLPRLSKIEGLAETKNIAVPGLVGDGALGLAAGAGTPGARRVSFCQPGCFLSAGLLYLFPAAALPASDRSGIVDPGSLLGF